MMSINLTCNKNYITRYCRPDWVINELPGYIFFMLREYEKYLSAYKMDLVKNNNNEESLEEIRDIIQNKDKSFKISKKGRFVVFETKNIIDLIYKETKYITKIKQVKLKNIHESHMGIYVSDNKEKNKIMALLIEKEIYNNQDWVYPGII